MKIIIFVLLIVLFGHILFVSAQEKPVAVNSLNVCEHRISVSIINGANLDNARLSIVKEAILSQESFAQDNNTYFKGWSGALKYIGSEYSFELSNMSSSDIVITLTAEENPEYNGWTTSHYISGHLIYSHIFIYDAPHIPDVALANLVRHEMGHALGLGHTTVISSIMYPLLPFTPKYISDNDLTGFKLNPENPLYLTSNCA